MSAIFSDDGLFRYLLERDVAEDGLIFAYFGVNPSTAGHEVEDQTSMKWRSFTKLYGGRKYMAANPFARIATDVRELATVDDPIGPDNLRYLRRVMNEADILIPCWGNRDKVPRQLHYVIEALQHEIMIAGKPAWTFGRNKSGDPKHPLMLGYDTPFQEWRP